MTKEVSLAVLSYGMYMANRWSEQEAKTVFGKNLGDHIWKKYVSYANSIGLYGAYSKLIYELDSNNLKLLVERANELYDGRKNL